MLKAKRSPVTNQMVTGMRLTDYIVKRDVLSSNRKVAGSGSQVALKHLFRDMEIKTLVMELRRHAIKSWVPCGDMGRRLQIPHSAKVECGFRTTPEECLYDSGLDGLQYRAS